MFGDPQLVHVDQVLTRISVGYSNPEFFGDRLFPSVSVPKQSDKYLVLDRNEARTVLDDIRGPKSQTKEMPPMGLARDTYFAEEHALKDWVAVEEQANSDPGFDVLARAARRVTDTILLNREDLIQTMVRLTTNYATGHTVTLAGGNQWSDYVNSNPITNLKTARDQIFFSTFKYPNIALLGYEVAAMLEDHPDFLDRMKTTPLASNNTLDAVGLLTGIPTLVRGSAVKNTAALGQAATFGYMWGKDVVLAYVPPNPGRDEPAFGYEFVWSFNEDTNPTDRWFDTDRKAWAVRTTRRYDLKFIAVDSVATGKSTGGYLIKNAIA